MSRYGRPSCFGVGVLLALVLSGCAGPSVGTPKLLPPNRLVVQIDLSTTEVAAGRPLKGVLLVYNPHAALNLSQAEGARGCRPSFAVVLSNGTISNGAEFSDVCPIQPFLISHGMNRLPFTVSTVFTGCIPSGVPNDGPPTASQPRCLPSGRAPRLPTGSYRAMIEWSLRVPPLPQPAPVTVDLT
jgi:hypothetical protein